MLNFNDYLNEEFRITKDKFMSALNKLPYSRTIVINVGMEILTNRLGNFNLIVIENLAKDLYNLIGSRHKRHVILVISGCLDYTRKQFTNSALFGIGDNKSSNLISLVISMVQNEVFEHLSAEFSRLNIKASFFTTSITKADDYSVFERTVKKISNVLSSTMEETKKIESISNIIENSKKKSPSIKTLFSENILTAINSSFEYFPNALPIIFERFPNVLNNIKREEDDIFASKIALLTKADALVSLSTKGLLYMKNPNEIMCDELLEPFYCYDTDRKSPFDKARRNEVRQKIDAARYVNTDKEKPIPMILMSLSQHYSISDVFSRSKVTSLIESGEFPDFTLFINCKHYNIPLGERKPIGTLIVDNDAAVALLERKCSLLGIGVISVEGIFEKGDTVLVMDCQNNLICKGEVRHSSTEIAEYIRDKVVKNFEVIKRNNMYFLKH